MKLFGRKGVPAEKTGQAVPYAELDFATAEQYRMLRTNLMFSLTGGKACSVVGVSSPEAGAGKSTTAVYLAHALADGGKRVLLVDGDMRRPAVGRMLHLRRKQGLSDLLLSMGEGGLSLEPSPSLPSLYVLTAGTIPPNPSELVGSGRMVQLVGMLSASFDCIILDLPPVNVVADAVAASPVVDGMLVVVRENHTGRGDLQRCVRRLEQAGVKILGFVLNDSRYEKGGRGRYGKYGKYGKYGDYYGKGGVRGD